MLTASGFVGNDAVSYPIRFGGAILGAVLLAAVPPRPGDGTAADLWAHAAAIQRLDNNLKCVDLSDLSGDLPLDVTSSRQIIERTEDWEVATWANARWPAPREKEQDSVGYPTVVRNDRGNAPDGKYYLYYAHHDPCSGIGCAVADKIDGPYKKLSKIDPQRKHSMVLVNPHYPAPPGDPSHYSSPCVLWNEDEKCWFMYFHFYNHLYATWRGGGKAAR